MATVLITGSNRGIGLELVRQSLEQGNTVIAACRKPDRAQELQDLKQEHPALRTPALDVSDQASMEAFVESLGNEPIDIFINNAGIYGQRDASLGNVDPEAWQRAFHVNTIAPLLLTELLLPNLRKGSGKRLIYVSSKMGSIDDNNSGGSYVYRSSKTALNQVVKSLAEDLRSEGFIVLSLHPGWVRTDMGGPNALIDTTTSVSGMLSVIAGATAEQSGRFLAYDGKLIQW